MSAVAERVAKAASIIAGKTYELSLTKGYVSRWGMVQAVREIIQNALDSESPFVYEFQPEGDDRFALRLNSEFTTLPPSTLLLGVTSKADRDDAIGSFGEGYKIALLVLTRLGFDVDVLNGELVWKPRFRFSRAFGEELLVIDESFAPDRKNKGLTFIVRGLDSNDVLEIRGSCIKMQAEVGEVKRTDVGDILVDQPGKLYVGGLYICDTDMKYGYDVRPSEIQLERDRQTVSSWDLKSIAVKIWYATGETRRIAEMIRDQFPDVEYSRFNAPELVKEECYRIFRQNNPGAIIAESPEEMREKIKAGMTKTVYVGGGMYYAVSSSRSYRSEAKMLEKLPPSPEEILTRFLRENRDEMRTKAIVAFKALIVESRGWAIGPAKKTDEASF